jgi:hypothetical protein
MSCLAWSMFSAILHTCSSSAKAHALYELHSRTRITVCSLNAKKLLVFHSTKRNGTLNLAKGLRKRGGLFKPFGLVYHLPNFLVSLRIVSGIKCLISRCYLLSWDFRFRSSKFSAPYCLIHCTGLSTSQEFISKSFVN